MSYSLGIHQIDWVETYNCMMEYILSQLFRVRLAVFSNKFVLLRNEVIT